MEIAMRVVLAVVLAACCAAPPAGAAEPLLTVEAKIPLGAVKGRIDHLAVDVRRQRLFVAELGNGSLGVIDLKAGTVLKRITGLKEPQGVAYAPGPDFVYLASGGDGTVRCYRGEDLSPASEPIKLGEDADNVRIDGADRLVVGYGDGALAILEAASGRKLGEAKLPAHPESFQLERDGSRAFVNLPKARQVGVVDFGAGEQIAGWAVADLGGNFPMALDEAAGRLFVAYREPATLVVFDTRTGAVAGRLRTVGDADDVFLDAQRHRIYVSGGEGAVAVVEARGDRGYAEINRVPTAAGARTSLFVPELDRLYVAARASRNEPAAVWVLRPADVP
jgi:DNA-binding beta-propeller fold protein YncE